MSEPWWGEFHFDLDATRYWRLGGFELWAERCEEEWKIAFSRGTDPLDERLEIGGEPVEPAPETATTYRFGYRQTRSPLKLVPVVADRSVVVRTTMPFFVPSGQDVTLYVSTALWIQIFARDPKTPLVDEPMFRPSDTWFGPSPREGEMCYSSQTSGRVHLENLTTRPHRVITVVKIRNRAETSLPVEKLRLPLPNLSVFAAKSGMLWTETVTLERHASAEMAEVRIARDGPSVAGATQRVSAPRVVERSSALTRTFSGLLGLGGLRNRERVVD